MDARTIARAARVKVGTLNSWTQRGLIPGMTIGVSGKKRAIDFATAVRIAIFAEMVRFGAAPDLAALAAIRLLPEAIKGGWMCFAVPDEPVGEGYARFTVYHEKQLADAAKQIESDQPAMLAAVNMTKLVERVRQAEAEWQEGQRGED